MWIETFHRFENEAAFLAACDAAGWARGPDGKPVPPAGVALDVIGAINTPPQVGSNGMPMGGQLMDARFHVNAAWHARPVPDSFRSSVVVPGTPQRVLSLPDAKEVPPPVPNVIPAWKGKVALREAGLLDAVEVAVTEASSRVQEAWNGASEWSRKSEFLLSLAEGLGLPPGQIDSLFRSADAIQG